MRTSWRRCAAAILITGSISSTSGAATTCAAAPPADARAALAGIAAEPGGEIAYREEIRHPALRTPETAGGSLRALPGGRFVKDQTWPRREISEVGDRFIRIRQTPDGEENVLPIPAGMLPMIDVLRLLVGGRIADAADAFEVGYDAGAAGWRIALTPVRPAIDLRIRLVGCGRRLERIEIDEPGGIERTYLLGAE